MISTVTRGNSTRFESPGGNTTTPLASPQLGAREVLVIHQEQLPGGTNPMHSKSTEAVVVVLAGTVEVVTAAETFALGEGDAALITPHTEHRLTNTGDALARWIVVTLAGVEFTTATGESIQPIWAYNGG